MNGWACLDLVAKKMQEKKAKHVLPLGKHDCSFEKKLMKSKKKRRKD